IHSLESYILFFFSSRRRHTRCYRDWSSDVCSSDLMAQRVYLTVAEVLAIHHRQIETCGGSHGLRDVGALEAGVFRPQTGYYNNQIGRASCRERVEAMTGVDRT